MAVAILAFLIIGMSIPMMSAGTDALDESDYRISIPGTAAPDKDVDVTIGNGMSYSWDVYVVNTSDKILDVTFNTSLSTKDMVISEKPKNTLLLSYTKKDRRFCKFRSFGPEFIRSMQYVSDRISNPTSILVQTASVLQSTSKKPLHPFFP